MVPKTFLSLRGGNGDNLVVSGRCIIITAMTSAQVVVTSFNLNPTSEQLFPRLSTIANAFEKYRFRSLRMGYTPGCSATRSGMVGIFCTQDPNEATPFSAPEVAAYKCSAVGAVSTSLATPNLRPEDPQFYFTSPSDLSDNLSAVEDQGRVCVMTGYSSSADVELLAGFVYLDFEVELINLRPQRQVSATYYGDLAGTSLLPSADGVNTIVPYRGPTAQSGFFDWAKNTLDSYTSGISFAESISALVPNAATVLLGPEGAAAANWLFRTFTGIGAEALAPMGSQNRSNRLKLSNLKFLSPMRKKMMSPVGDQSLIARVKGLQDSKSLQHHSLVGYFSPDHYVFREEFKEQLDESVLSADLTVLKRAIRGPDAVGDVSVGVVYANQGPLGATGTLYIDTINNPLAFYFESSQDFNITETPVKFAARYYVPVGDSRVFNTDAFFTYSLVQPLA